MDSYIQSAANLHFTQFFRNYTNKIEFLQIILVDYTCKLKYVHFQSRLLINL